MFEKKWQFSAFLVAKGFKVLEVGSAEDFDDGNIDKAEPQKVNTSGREITTLTS